MRQYSAGPPSECSSIESVQTGKARKLAHAKLETDHWTITLTFTGATTEHQGRQKTEDERTKGEGENRRENGGGCERRGEVNLTKITQKTRSTSKNSKNTTFCGDSRKWWKH